MYIGILECCLTAYIKYCIQDNAIMHILDAVIIHILDVVLMHILDAHVYEALPDCTYADL